MGNVTKMSDRAGGRRTADRRTAPETSASGPAVIGYATISGSEDGVNGQELTEQAEVIARECERRGLALLELVRERQPENGKALERPGLGYALRRISAGEANGLVVSELSRVTHSVAELGAILKWFSRSAARLVAVAQALDTLDRDGHLAARALVEVSNWEHQRLSERTRKGLEAARQAGGAGGRPAVSDYPELGRRIARMRAQGMTLQAIADRLNEESVPTVRGGAKWRHSSVQAAAGYRRRRRTPPAPLLEGRTARKER